MAQNPRKSALLTALLAVSTSSFAIAEEACLPVSGEIIGAFGPMFHPILKEVQHRDGVSWVAEPFAPVLAAMDGRITEIHPTERDGYTISVAFENGLLAQYRSIAELSDGVREGAFVSSGEPIGFAGATDRVETPIVRFNLEHDGRPVNPFAPTPIQSNDLEALAQMIVAELPQWVSIDQTVARPASVVQRLEEVRGIFETRGHHLTLGQLYLSYQIGIDELQALIAAESDAKVLSVLAPLQMRANPQFADYTVSEIFAWADDRVRRMKVDTTIEVRMPIEGLTLNWVQNCA